MMRRGNGNESSKNNRKKIAEKGRSEEENERGRGRGSVRNGESDIMMAAD